MASGKSKRPRRNHALAVMTKMFGAERGWAQGVADAEAVAEIGEEVYALRQRHGLTQLGLATWANSEFQVHCRSTAAEARGR